MRRRTHGPKFNELIICGYCLDEWAQVYDHLVPVAYGGTNKKSNLFPSCNRCNLLVSSKVFDTIEAKVAFVRSELNRKHKYKNFDPAIVTPVKKAGISSRISVEAKCVPPTQTNIKIVLSRIDDPQFLAYLYENRDLWTEIKEVEYT